MSKSFGNHRMRETRQKNLMTLLGAGGQDPRVDIIDTESLEMRTSIGLPPMHSAYAIDVDWHGERFFVGTKGGDIYNIVDFLDQGLRDRLPSRTLIQGAPILSVSHVGHSRLVASDIAGRCLLWETERDEIPITLETKGEVICSLLTLHEQQVVGLSSEGIFFNWNLAGPELLYARHVCPPPPIGGLIKMVFWPAAQAIVYPGRRGDLNVYDPEKDNMREIKAHDGAFYALCLLGETLLTIGMQDRCLKLWMPDSKQPFCDLIIPDEILSVSHLGGLKSEILLIDSKGVARTYVLDEDDLVGDRHLDGKDYRVSISPPSQMIAAHSEMRKEQEAHEIWAELRDPGRSDQGATEMYLSRLEELGYKHVTMALQAEKLEKEGNIVESLRLRSALVQMLPEHPAACPSFERYAVSLDRLWLLPEAEKTYQWISRIDPNYHFSLDFDRISRIAELMRTSDWTIEPDIPVRDIIAACNALNQMFKGRYAIKKLPPFHCRRKILDSETITEKYEEIQRTSGQESWPAVESKNHWWISRTETYEIEIVMFGKAPRNDINGLRFALQVFPHAQGTVVVPVVLFDWQNDERGSTAEKLNERASMAFDRLTNGTASSYVKEISRIAQHVLRRLIAKNS